MFQAEGGSPATRPRARRPALGAEPAGRGRAAPSWTGPDEDATALGDARRASYSSRAKQTELPLPTYAPKSGTSLYPSRA